MNLSAKYFCTIANFRNFLRKAWVIENSFIKLRCRILIVRGIFNYRNYLASKRGMGEFLIAHSTVVIERKKPVIIILKEKLQMMELPKEIRVYIQTRRSSIIDATANTSNLMKTLRSVKNFKESFIW